MNNRRCGERYEKIAARFLMEKGLVILDYNFRCRLGEIDLVAKDGEVVVFVEVKYRGGTSKGSAREAITPGKQAKIAKVSDYYRLIKHITPNTSIRYDAVCIEADEIFWIKNAFMYMM